MLTILVSIVEYAATILIILLFLRAILARFISTPSGPLYMILTGINIVTDPLVKPVYKLCQKSVPLNKDLSIFFSFIIVLIARTLLLYLISFLAPLLH